MINYGQQDELDIPGVPDDTVWLGKKLDALTAMMAQVANAITNRETPARGVYWAMTTHNDFPQQVRVRLREFVYSVSAACTVTLKIGSSNYLSFDVAGADRFVIPLPIAIDAGTDVLVSISAGTLRAAYFTGYPEA